VVKVEYSEQVVMERLPRDSVALHQPGPEELVEQEGLDPSAQMPQIFPVPVTCAAQLAEVVEEV